MKNILHYLFILGFAFLLAFNASSQVGEVIWQEDFNNLDNWIIETGNGSWGWGNGELEFYQSDNVTIEEISEEPGNFALCITARQESGANIVDQWGNPLNYTSGRINSKSKVSLQYGVVETRVRIPNIDLGGWPAVWMLGTANYSWPSKGEIDIMEMGHQQAFRDLHDGHNGGNGLNNSTVNQMVGSNAIFYSEDAINPDNPSGASSLAWDPEDEYCRPYFNHDDPLIDRYLIYRTYWDESSLRFTVIDNDIEYDLFSQPFIMDSISDEFNQPFFLIVNMAIGGAFTDAYNLGDPGSGDAVSMPLDAEMFVDYIKVMEWNGQGGVNVGPPQEQLETFGIFTDETPTNNALFTNEPAHIYVWEGTLSDGSIPPYEGENGISWVSNGFGWFGAGIMSTQPINLLGFGEGHLKFRIKIPANVSFQIGVIDTWGNQNYVEFPANQTKYELVRNGEWGQASIPVSDLRGEFIDLRMLSYEFVILEVNGVNCEFALDDIYYDGGIVAAIEQTILNTNPLLSIYPNPILSQATVECNLEESGPLEIAVYDIFGRKIDVLVNDYRPSGRYQFQWNPKNLNPGIYFIHLKTASSEIIKKTIIQ